MQHGIRILIVLVFVSLTATAQQQIIIKETTVDDVPKGWHLLDASSDGYNGISLKKSYDFLKGKKSKTVTVAVIDSGVDTLHEDLQHDYLRQVDRLD